MIEHFVGQNGEAVSMVWASLSTQVFPQRVGIYEVPQESISSRHSVLSPHSAHRFSRLRAF